jgi:hypothetical protein
MRVTKQTDRYVILDDVLPPEQFELMVEYAPRNDYARNPRWIKPWDLGDEMPWQTGETVYSRGKALAPQDPRKAYPTGMAVDLLIKRILESKFYRERVPDTYVTARSYLHPPGSGLDWHDDEGRFEGAYTYYVNPRWHASWGGELLVIEDDLPRSLLPQKRHMRDGKIETGGGVWNVITKDDLSQMLLEGTTQTEFIFPRPNRLVFLKGGTWHKINPVKRNAAFARCAIAGFFLGERDQTPFWR